MNEKIAPPELREPEARELSDQGKLLAVVTLLRAKCSEREWEGLPAQLKDVLPKEIAELRAERDKALKAVAQWARIGHPILDALENHKPLGSMGIEPEPYVTRIEELLAAERSLLQARKDLEYIWKWAKHLGYAEVEGYAETATAALASTSAPEGTV